MEAELGIEERALNMGSGFYNPSDTNCAYLCSPDPLSRKESSVQVSITPIPDKMEPVVLPIISAPRSRLPDSVYKNTECPIKCEFQINKTWFCILSACMFYAIFKTYLH